MKKNILLYISHGHGQDNDPGAVSGKFEERTLAIKVAKACYDYLSKHRKEYGYALRYPEKTLGKFGLHLWEDNQKTASYAKKYRVVSIDIHFNAGGGDGMECFCKGTEHSKILGRYICEAFQEIGQNYHGNPIKGADGLQFLKNSGTSVLVECGFVDNKTDRKLFDTDAELKKMGEAIAKALIRYYKRYK